MKPSDGPFFFAPGTVEHFDRPRRSPRWVGTLLGAITLVLACLALGQVLSESLF